AGRTPRPLVVELSSCDVARTRLLLDAWGAGSRPMAYAPVELSRALLEPLTRTLATDYPALVLRGLIGLPDAALEVLPPEPRVVVLALGGVIGHYTPAHELGLYRALRTRLAPGAHVVIGFDRRAHAGKPPTRIQLAYDDPA